MKKESSHKHGTPRAKLNPWLFIIMINDLCVPGVETWKYVDDIIMSECVDKNNSSSIQEAANLFSIKTLIRLILQKPEISAGSSMGHLAYKGSSISSYNYMLLLMVNSLLLWTPFVI